MTLDQSGDGWRSAWPDVVAFVSVLFLAWWARANAADLVWSLWLSSLVVGYTIILWTIFHPAFQIASLAWRERGLVRQTLTDSKPTTSLLVAALTLFGALFLLAFLSVHFLGFHYVHGSFLESFFPIGGEHGGARNLEGVALFREALRRYWPYLPASFLAERAAFMRPSPLARVMNVDVTAAAITARKRMSASQPASAMLLPYQKVIRMHLLIFFFAFAHFAKLENFAVYAVVYAVYFFPWRLVSSASKAAPAVAPGSG